MKRNFLAIAILSLLRGVAATAIIVVIGCATPDTAKSLPPAFGVLERSCLSRNQKRLLARAETDFNRILEGRIPQYAIAVFLIMDGGTQIYYGNGYELTSYRSMTERHGEKGYIVGPAIKLERKITGGNPLCYEQTTFVTKENLPPRG